MELAELWRGARGGGLSGEAKQALQQVREFVARHEQSRFQPLREGRPDQDWRGGDRAGFRHENHVFILGDVWRTEVVAGLDPRQAARDLAEAGTLISADGRNLMTKLPFRIGADRPRAYQIRRAILLDAADDARSTETASDGSDLSDAPVL